MAAPGAISLERIAPAAQFGTPSGQGCAHLAQADQKRGSSKKLPSPSRQRTTTSVNPERVAPAAQFGTPSGRRCWFLAKPITNGETAKSQLLSATTPTNAAAPNHKNVPAPSDPHDARHAPNVVYPYRLYPIQHGWTTLVQQSAGHWLPCALAMLDQPPDAEARGKRPADPLAAPAGHSRHVAR